MLGLALFFTAVWTSQATAQEPQKKEKKTEVQCTQKKAATQKTITATCGGKNAKAQSSAVTSEKKMDKNAVAYQCPMKCEGNKTYDKPGKCPKCGMELKKIKSKKTDIKFSE